MRSSRYRAGARWRQARAARSGAPRSVWHRWSLAPGKILCVGLNYAHHVREMGRELPEHSTLFAKYPEALVGPFDDVVLPPESDAVDWEAELAVVVGATVRRASAEEAADVVFSPVDLVRYPPPC